MNIKWGYIFVLPYMMVVPRSIPTDKSDEEKLYRNIQNRSY